ncbi:MAG: metFprotein [Rhodospirillaceae bacterium TMED8]|nr:metFprotein [Magnetovibrio sp.]OUT52198.1 MAG: metFprotein [Rhodospirillaceae bacterium TMED8]|tara:strand:+ start:200 stop:1132 length:933 start_codon:yes stop_codon:yes gene_type:complete
MPLTASNLADESIDESVRSFVNGFTAETTPFSAAKIDDFREVLRPGTTVFVTFLPGSDYTDTLEVTKRLQDEGMRPVPHIAARSVPNKAFLEENLKILAEQSGIDEVLIIGGAVDQPVGDFSDSMQIMETGLLDKYGIKKVGIAGHPEGSPDITQEAIRDALAWKNEFAERSGAELYIVTQFCFEAEPIIAWDKAIQSEGNRLPIRIGLPGLATIKTLLNFAKACGVGQSMNFLKRQGKNVAKLMTVSTPDKQMIDLARYKLEDPKCGITGVHMYPLGGVKKTAKWSYAVCDGHFDVTPKGDGFKVNIDL